MQSTMMKSVRMQRSTVSRASVKPQAFSLQKAAQTAGMVAASLAITLAAHADTTVLLGSSSGALVFEPSTINVKSGETITFKNNAGFPHNIVFDEDNVPAGVNADALSRDEYLNAPGEEYKVQLTTAGTYGIYCEPHQGAGMVGTVIVQ